VEVQRITAGKHGPREKCNSEENVERGCLEKDLMQRCPEGIYDQNSSWMGAVSRSGFSTSTAQTGLQGGRGHKKCDYTPAKAN
jgi:hypothetical protein